MQTETHHQSFGGEEKNALDPLTFCLRHTVNIDGQTKTVHEATEEEIIQCITPDDFRWPICSGQVLAISTKI